MDRQRWIGIIILASRIILGGMFIFSGFVKGMDPMGSAYKFTDYFTAFGMDFLLFLAVPMAFLLPVAEFLIGISLFLNLRFRLGAWAVLVFMSFFTLLTLFIALTDPVSDCGCFGDAIILTNWQTFLKNIILLPFVFTVFLFRDRQAEIYPAPFAWTGMLVFAMCFLGMEVYVYRHLPLMDFRPYNVGTYIPGKMTLPEGAPRDVYKTVLYYEKDGKVEEFTEDNFPWQDTTWKYVDSKNTLVSKGDEPSIHDFNIVDSFGTDIASDVLADPGFSFLLISDHLEKADTGALRYADELNAWCDAMGHSFYCMTASEDALVRRLKNDLGLEFWVYSTDETTLKTIVRANPGLLVLREGTILAKWHYNDFPDLEDISSRLLSGVLTRQRQVQERRLGINAILVLALAGLFMFTVFPRVREP